MQNKRRRTVIMLLIVVLLPIKISSAFGDAETEDVTKAMFALCDKSKREAWVEDLRKNNLRMIDLNDSSKVYSRKTYLEWFKTFDSVDYNFFAERIPDEYLLTFLYFTKDNKRMRNMIFSIMQHESQGFTRYINDRNANGSSDHGPMMLNSYNIKNGRFMINFQKDRELLENMGYDMKTKDGLLNWYTAIGIKMYINLVERYEKRQKKDPMWYALRAYNCGESVNTRYASDIRRGKADTYASKVIRIYRKINKVKNNYILSI